MPITFTSVITPLQKLLFNDYPVTLFFGEFPNCCNAPEDVCHKIRLLQRMHGTTIYYVVCT
jgi:hypothetical protein